MKTVLLAAALLLLFSRAEAATTAVDFLNFQIGARATAMGGAYSSVADDATALYWNPAALTRIQRRSASLMHAEYLDSSSYDYAAYGQNLGRAGALGASVQYYSAGSIPQTDAVGADAGSFTPYDLAATAGYAYTLPEFELANDFSHVSLGIAAKYIQSKIVSSAHAEAVDLGLLTPKYLDGRLRWAVTYSNLGGHMRYGVAEERLPQSLRGGISFLITPSWTVAADGVIPVIGTSYASAGTEYRLATGGPWGFALRGGVDTQTMDSITGFSGVAMGFGLGYQGASFDYAFVPMGGLGQAHRLSLTFNF